MIRGIRRAKRFKIRNCHSCGYEVNRIFFLRSPWVFSLPVMKTVNEKEGKKYKVYDDDAADVDVIIFP